MKTTFLDFEQPIAELENRIEELRFVQDDSAVDISEEIQRLGKRSQTLTKEIYGKLSPWQVAQVARHPQRPYTLDYIAALFTQFEELHGDRTFADDPTIVGGRTLQWRAVHGDRPPERPRHQGKDPAQFRHAAPRGLPQGAAPNAAGGKIFAAGVHLRRYARRLPGHRGRGAQPVRSHRPQP